MRTIIPSDEAQPVDFLEEMLRRGRRPTLASLLALAPPEPLGPPEGWTLVRQPGGGLFERERKRWPQSSHKRRERFAGYQPGHLFRESMKYGHGVARPEHAMPEENAPLASYVRKRIQHARAKWCGQLDAKRTTLQFVEWLRLHLDYQTVGDGGPLWPDDLGGWSRSFQLLRLAYGLPRFAPTRRKRT